MLDKNDSGTGRMKICLQRLQVFSCLFSAILLVTLNIFVFNTFDIFRENSSEFELGYLNLLDLFWPAGFWFIFLTLILGFFLPLKFTKRYASFFLALGVLTWIQASFLLWDYGVFDGRDTNWEQHDFLGWLDITLWLGTLLVALRHADRIVPLSNLIAWILIFGQAILLYTQGILDKGDWIRQPSLSNKPPDAIFELSRQQNILHIVLDSMQTDVFLELVKTLDLYEDLDGFTLFYENSGVTLHTSLALPAIFSGEVFDGSQPVSSYYKTAMTSGFQNSLYQAGYIVNLIPQMSMQDSSYTNYYPIPGIYNGTVEDLKHQNAVQLLDISLFRSAPHFIRKAIYDDGEWFLLAKATRGMDVRSFQIKAFFSDYTKELKLGGDVPAYNFIHLMPPHPPYVTLADGRYAGEILPNTRENYLNESRAIMELVLQYIEKLKSLDVYSDSMIILQGDHGSQINPVVDGSPIQTCVTRMAALLAVKPPKGEGSLRISNAPTSLLDVAPTVLKVLGNEAQSVFELDESLSRQRPFVVFDGSRAVARIKNYSINGSVYDPQSCKKSDSRDINSGTGHYNLGSKITFGLTGNADSFMGAGWSTCQADYCWSAGHQADITLNTDEATTDLVLHFQFKPYVEGHQQRIGVSLNGTQLTELLVSEYVFQNASVRIPAKLAKSESLQIRFSFPDAVSPRSLNLNSDDRLLGMALRTLRIEVPDIEQSH